MPFESEEPGLGYSRVKSRGERESGKQKDGTLTYGEVPYDAMDKILEAVHEIRGRT